MTAKSDYSETPDQLIARAHEARKAGDRAASLALWQKAAELSPQHAGIIAETAADLRELGRLEESEALLRPLLQREPPPLEAFVGLAHIMRKRGDRAASLTFWQRARAAAPDHAGVAAETAADLRERGRLDEAEALLRPLLQREPPPLEAFIGLAHIARKRGDRAASLELWKTAHEAAPDHAGIAAETASDLRELGRLDEAEALLRGQLERQPQQIEALIGLGHIARRRGDRAAALAAFEAAEAAAPHHTGVTLEVVNGLREFGRLGEAETKLIRLLDREPAHNAARLALGALKLAAFKLDEAEALFRAVQAAAPDDAACLVNLGALARRRNDHDEALGWFQAALVLHPAHTGVALEVAAELRELGHYKAAASLLDALCLREPENVQPVMQAGYLARRRGDRAQALARFRAAHERWPHQTQALIEMAIEQRALGQPGDSHRFLELALAIDPDYPAALEQLAEHHWIAEDPDASLALCRRIIAAHPARLQPYLHASRAAAELGQGDEAQKFLDQAEAFAGPHPEIRSMRIALLRRARDWDGARALLLLSEDETRRYAGLWTQRATLAITTGDYAGAEAALPHALPVTVHEASRVHLIRGQIAEARWSLEEAAAQYRAAIALDANDTGAHAELARVSLKLLNPETCRHHLGAMARLTASHNSLRGGAANLSQTHVGQLLDEYTIDAPLLEGLRDRLTLSATQQAEALLPIVAENPDSTPAAATFLIALRRAGLLVRPPIPSDCVAKAAPIPRRIMQFWDEADLPGDIAQLMESWRERNPKFEYVLMDDRKAQEFLRRHGLSEALSAYRRAREPARRADLFRLAYLSIEGGFYADADDRCLANIETFVPPEPEFVAFQEDYGTIGNNFIGAVRAHPVICRALQAGTAAVNRGDHEFLWLSTGPGLLTRAFAQFLAHDETRTRLSGETLIFDMGELQRHVGFHCPVRYKQTRKHWSRSSFMPRRQSRRRAQHEAAEPASHRKDLSHAEPVPAKN